MSFLAAPLLAGLLLVAVPLWLHRTSRAAPERGFSSLFLMRAAEEPVHAERSLRHLVLLAARCALLAAAALAFARPVLSMLVPQDGCVETAGEACRADSGSAADRMRLVVLDRSLSMRRPAAWEGALQRVQELVAEGPARIVAAGAELELLATVRGASPGAGRLDFAGLAARLDTLAGSLPEGGSGVEVHIVSDFQASAMPARFNALIDGGHWPVTLHSVAAPTDNWAVESVRVERDAVVARVASHAGTQRDLRVSLRVAGVEEERVSVTLAPGARAEASFPRPASLEDADDVAVEVALEPGDALAGDDLRRWVHRGRQSHPLPIVAFARSATAADYLAAAVDAAALPVAPLRIDASDAETWPAGTSVVALVDPGTLSESVMRHVARHLGGGGGVFVAVGPRVSGSGRIPFLDQAVDVHNGLRGTNARVVVEDPGHPAAGDGWPEVEVSRSLVPVDADTGRTILALEDGRPLLVEFPVGRGRMLVLYTALDRDWTSLPVRPAFVRFVAAALRYLGNDPGTLQAVAEEAVSVPASSVQFFDADGARVLGLASTTRRPTVRFREPGFYSAHTPGRRALVAVNVDLRESDLRPTDPAVLARWQAAAGVDPGDAPTSSSSTQIGAGPRLQPLAPWLLGLLAVLLLLEPVFANLGASLRRMQRLAGRVGVRHA